tara:strand:+ start:457 stop:732 length:276 start_codon:yes stop_codon:yes gene_type:complete
MKELDDIKEQEELIYYAMHDSYRIITNKISTAGFMIEKDKQDIDFVLLFDIHDLRTLKKGTLESIIEYFSDLEEYEICAELVAYKIKRGWK